LRSHQQKTRSLKKKIGVKSAKEAKAEHYCIVTFSSLRAIKRICVKKKLIDKVVIAGGNNNGGV